MSDFGTYAGNKILELITGKTAFTKPTAYIFLSTTDPGVSGSGITEPVGFAYARLITTGSDWAAAASESISNATDLVFTMANGGSWGVITHIGLIDTASGAGNMLIYKALSSTATVADQITFHLPIGSLTFTLV